MNEKTPGVQSALTSAVRDTGWLTVDLVQQSTYGGVTDNWNVDGGYAVLFPVDLTQAAVTDAESVVIGCLGSGTCCSERLVEAGRQQAGFRQMGQGLGVCFRGWWRICRKGRHALLPSCGEFVDEGLHLREFFGMDPQEGHASSEEDVVH